MASSSPTRSAPFTFVLPNGTSSPSAPAAVSSPPKAAVDTATAATRDASPTSTTGYQHHLTPEHQQQQQQYHQQQQDPNSRRESSTGLTNTSSASNLNATGNINSILNSESPSTTLPQIRHIDNPRFIGSTSSRHRAAAAAASSSSFGAAERLRHSSISDGGTMMMMMRPQLGARTPSPMMQQRLVMHGDVVESHPAVSSAANNNNNNNSHGRHYHAMTPSPFVSRAPEVQEIVRDAAHGVSRMICNNEFDVSEFYGLRLIVGDSRSSTAATAKLPVHLPHIDLSWMRPLFQAPAPGKQGYSRTDIERISKECATKTLATLNLDCLADDTRNFGPDALHPVLLNSPRSALVLLRNGISVTKLLARPPAYYATDRVATLAPSIAGGAPVSSVSSTHHRSPDRLLLHLRKQRADEVRHHLVAQIMSQYRTLCEGVTVAEAILACCPPSAPEPEVALETQLAREMQQLEQLRNRTTMAVSRAVREQRELEERVAARQQRTEVTELACRERINAKLESLRERDAIRKERLRRVREGEREQEQDVHDQYRHIANAREEKTTKHTQSQMNSALSRAERVAQRLREAQEQHRNADVLRLRRFEHKATAKSVRLKEIKECRAADEFERRLDFAELERAREEARHRAADQALEFRRRAASKVLIAAQRADEAENKKYSSRVMMKSLAELENERRSSVVSRARILAEEKSQVLEQRLVQHVQHQQERNVYRAHVLRSHAAAHAIDNLELQEVHEANAQQNAFQRMCGVAVLQRKEDVSSATQQQKKLMDESGQWIRSVARYHFEAQRKRIAENIRKNA